MENIKIETENSKWKIDFWTIALGILALNFSLVTLLFPSFRIAGLILIGATLVLILLYYYIKRIDINEKNINTITNLIKEIKNKFNYLIELNKIKLDLELIKNKLKMNKKGQFKLSIIDILKGVIIIILVYVSIQVFISLTKG